MHSHPWPWCLIHGGFLCMSITDACVSHCHPPGTQVSLREAAGSAPGSSPALESPVAARVPTGGGAGGADPPGHRGSLCDFDERHRLPEALSALISVPGPAARAVPAVACLSSRAAPYQPLALSQNPSPECLLSPNKLISRW